MAVSKISTGNLKTAYYNANTDRTVVANRYNALLDVMDLYGREANTVIMATIRYSGGYYYTYFFNPARADDVVLEIGLPEFNIWNINRGSGTYYVYGTTFERKT